MATQSENKDSDEYLIKENPGRFVIFPIKHADIWEAFQKHRRAFFPMLGVFFENVTSIVFAFSWAIKRSMLRRLAWGDMEERDINCLKRSVNFASPSSFR